MSFLQKHVVNLYITYKLDKRSRDLALGNCLFSAAKLTKNAYPDKCGYSGFDAKIFFFGGGGGGGARGRGRELITVLVCILIVNIN